MKRRPIKVVRTVKSSSQPVDMTSSFTFGSSAFGAASFGSTGFSQQTCVGSSSSDNAFSKHGSCELGTVTHAQSQHLHYATKYMPVWGTDTMVKSGLNISTKHLCLTAMKEYETKSMDELRWEDYLILSGQCSDCGPDIPLPDLQVKTTEALFNNHSQIVRNHLTERSNQNLVTTSFTNVFPLPDENIVTKMSAFDANARFFGTTVLSSSSQSGSNIFFGSTPSSTATSPTIVDGCSFVLTPSTATSSSGFGSSSFGSTPSSTTCTTSSSIVGGSSFGSTPAATAFSSVTNNSSFGSPSSTATSSVFGPTPSSTTTNSSVIGDFSFASPSSTATSSLFGGSSFGSTPSSTATISSVTGSSTFGSPSSTATSSVVGGSSFGSSPASTVTTNSASSGFSLASKSVSSAAGSSSFGSTPKSVTTTSPLTSDISVGSSPASTTAAINSLLSSALTFGSTAFGLSVRSAPASNVANTTSSSGFSAFSFGSTSVSTTTTTTSSVSFGQTSILATATSSVSGDFSFSPASTAVVTPCSLGFSFSPASTAIVTPCSGGFSFSPTSTAVVTPCSGGFSFGSKLVTAATASNDLFVGSTIQVSSTSGDFLSTMPSLRLASSQTTSSNSPNVTYACSIPISADKVFTADPQKQGSIAVSTTSSEEQAAFHFNESRDLLKTTNRLLEQQNLLLKSRQAEMESRIEQLEKTNDWLQKSFTDLHFQQKASRVLMMDNAETLTQRLEDVECLCYGSSQLFEEDCDDVNSTAHCAASEEHTQEELNDCDKCPARITEKHRDINDDLSISDEDVGAMSNKPK